MSRRNGECVRYFLGVIEAKRMLDGTVVEYATEPLAVEPGRRVVLLCRIDEPEIVAGGRMTLARGTLSVGHFWFDRPYNVYHWLRPPETVLYYVNIGRVVSLTDDVLTWDDYAVDVLAHPSGEVEVIDEDEIPPTTRDELRAEIAAATAAVLSDLQPIIGEVEAETRGLLANASR